MLWSEFLTHRATVRALALEQAAYPTAAALAGWRLPHPLQDQLLNTLTSAELRPSPASFGAIFAPDDTLRQPSGAQLSLASHVWWERLETLAPPMEPGGELQRRAWALVALRWLGFDRDRLERRAWRGSMVPSPQDPTTLRCWRAWFQGDNYQRLWHDWKRLFASAAARQQTVVMTLGALPAQLREERRADLMETFLEHCWEPDQAGVPAWREIAVRVLERAGQEGPIYASAALLGQPERETLALCAVHHTTWRKSWLTVEPEPGEEHAEHRFLDRWAEAANAEGAGLDAMLDAHLIVRLLALWRDPARTSSERSWRVLKAQLGRARARLRALVSRRPDAELLAGLHELDAPYQRTLDAIKRYFWEWTWKDIRTGSNGVPVAVNASCELPPLQRRRLARDADAHHSERCWVLLMLLRGHKESLFRWRDDGGKTNGTFARLLKDLPDALIDQPQGKYRGYDDLRASLKRRMGAYLRELEPTLRAVAALRETPARKLKKRLSEVLRPVWHPSVEMPRGAFPSMIQAAEALVSAERAP